MPSKRGPKAPLTDQHKAALALGRSEGKIVRDYLDALHSNKPKRGRRRTSDSISKRLTDISAELADADPVRRLKLIQERMNLEAEQSSSGQPVDLDALEKSFIEVAKGYSQRSGLSYSAWRQVGVSPVVLSKAGISRGG